MVTPPRDSVAEARSGPIALSKSIENLPDQQCDRGKRGDAPVERSDPDEITLVSSEYVAAPYCSTRDRTYKEESEPQEVHEIVTRAEIHETNQAEDGRQIYIDIAAMSQENRFFVNVQIGKFTYRALMDSGAQCCLAGPKMMQDLADRIRPSPTVIGFANSQDESSSGCLPVMLQVDREAGRVVLECVKILPVEMVLGADFGRCWKVDIGMGRDQWRSNDGPWHDLRSLAIRKCVITLFTAECAGITVKPSERELVLQKKVMRLIPDVSVELGYTDKIKHKIELIEGARPVCQRARRMSDKMEKIAIEHVSKMLREGIIEEACSEWNSAPVIVKKSDGSHRFCVDYRDLNKVTKKDGYPCKNMDEILDKLRKARYISKIDLKSAYHQVLMEESSKSSIRLSRCQAWANFSFRRLPIWTEMCTYDLPAINGQIVLLEGGEKHCLRGVPAIQSATEWVDRAYDEEGRRSTLGCSSGGYDGVSAAKQESKQVLVSFSRLVYAVDRCSSAEEKRTGANVLRAFEELVLFRWETPPEFFLTDNGREFDNGLLNEALEGYGVKHLFTPPYHAQANPVERSNRTLKTMIASFVNDKHDEWDRYLPQFRYAVNTAVQSTIKVSPAFLNMGRQPRQAKSLRREVEKWCTTELMERKRGLKGWRNLTSYARL
ncbi:unnamed protein product [Trichogramma brassicae]|uniref:Integrase catalytic domain-containing protein n=1 Tax=Trichogramma brassicae TaxID=86971 RepID=A0A6H5IPB4_9HYME|nr:unnamed protein product [Trichogramma brassicae]